MAADARPLKESLRVLRNAAPEEFRHFAEMLTLYKDGQVLAAAMAQQAEVLTVQGHARQCIALVDMVKEAEK